ncbi:hypothetical protein BY996DRAFT_8474029 [Phakopsora pachyrhizi]|nr:hypothetical protein BY996DRAFT_8474029 [Phakopsora pachyrhizi]
MAATFRPNRKNFCFLILQLALCCLIVEAGFIEKIFRGKAETSELESQVKEPLLSETRSDSLGYLVDEFGQPLAKYVRKENLDDNFEEVTRKYFNQVPTSSKNPIEPSKLMVKIKQIVEEVKQNRFIRIEKTDRDENREKLDIMLSKRLKEASNKYTGMMDLSGKNRRIKKDKASYYDEIREAKSDRQLEDMADSGRNRETPKELLKDMETIQSATKYILEQKIVQSIDIPKTLEAMVLDNNKIRTLILKLLILYSELWVSHYGDQIPVSAQSNIKGILKDLKEGNPLGNKVWEGAFDGDVSNVAHYNSRMIYHIILYHAYSFNNPQEGSNMIDISNKIQCFKHVLRIQQGVINFYRTKKFMGIELKFDSEYKNYMDEISKMRLENRETETTTVDSFKNLKSKVSEAKFDKSILAENLLEWQRSIHRSRWWTLENLKPENPNVYDQKTVKHSDDNLQWEIPVIIKLTNLYNKSYFRNANLSLEILISDWLKEVKGEITVPKKKKLPKKTYTKKFSRQN